MNLIFSDSFVGNINMYVIAIWVWVVDSRVRVIEPRFTAVVGHLHNQNEDF